MQVLKIAITLEFPLSEFLLKIPLQNSKQEEAEPRYRSESITAPTHGSKKKRLQAPV